MCLQQSGRSCPLHPFPAFCPRPCQPGIPETQSVPGTGIPARKRAPCPCWLKKTTEGRSSVWKLQTPGARQSRITAYLLDASSLKVPLADLALEWENSRREWSPRLRVEGSDNLEDWTLLVPSAVLINLRYGDHRLERRVIELNGAKMKYYRLSSTGSTELPKLISAVARLTASGAELPRHWTSVTATPRSSRTGDYLFTTSGLMPVDRIRVRLPQENTLVQASFFSRATERDPWKPGTSTLLYRLRIKGEELTSPDIVLPASSDRYRLMRIDQSGGGHRERPAADGIGLGPRADPFPCPWYRAFPAGIRQWQT